MQLLPLILFRYKLVAFFARPTSSLHWRNFDWSFSSYITVQSRSFFPRQVVLNTNIFSCKMASCWYLLLGDVVLSFVVTFCIGIFHCFFVMRAIKNCFSLMKNKSKLDIQCQTFEMAARQWYEYDKFKVSAVWMNLWTCLYKRWVGSGIRYYEIYVVWKRAFLKE